MRQCGRRHAGRRHVGGGMWVWHVGWTPRFPARRGRPEWCSGWARHDPFALKCKIRPECGVRVTFSNMLHVSWACGLARELMLARALMALSENLGATAGPPAISSTGAVWCRGCEPSLRCANLPRQPLLGMLLGLRQVALPSMSEAKRAWTLIQSLIRPEEGTGSGDPCASTGRPLVHLLHINTSDAGDGARRWQNPP